ncbi:hypothetical protein L873DRAFT_1805667 [Choiromyces venosus 120613-1]|uniref:Uncharacterized protein n=1 Tax=Choiromyces venosus 120613-1 TaxID=1336337 RepID=A0A3N4JPU4_9PEZI|nr:hypothetical protein L873DRAFT_1805667 [Choiromyces venosus 120613-1]
MGNTPSVFTNPYKTPRKHDPRIFNFPLPSTPFRLPHFLPQLIKLNKKAYNTETTTQSINRLKNILAATTIMLNTYSILSPETHPELRAHFAMFKEGAEDFYLNQCEELVVYNSMTGWYDVQHGKVARGVDEITKEYFWLSMMVREVCQKEKEEREREVRGETRWRRVKEVDEVEWLGSRRVEKDERLDTI